MVAHIEKLINNPTLVFGSFIAVGILSFLFCKLCKTDTIKINVYKISLTVGMITLLTTIIRAGYIWITKSGNPEDTINGILTLFFMNVSLPSMIILFFGNIEFKEIKVFEIPYRNIEEFNIFLKNKLDLKQYKIDTEIKNVTIFKKKEKNKTEIVISAYLENLTPEKFDETYNCKILPHLEKEFEYTQKNRFHFLYIIYILNTNKVTPAFNRFLKETVSDKRVIRVPIGISYGGNKLYINDALDGFEEPLQTKTLKKYVKILELNNKKSAH